MGTPNFVTLSDGTPVAYEVIGDGGRPLMLFNGVTTTHFFWDDALARWKDRTVILWDYPGHGDSPPSRTPDSARIEGLAEAGLRVLDAVGVERATAIGYSMGSQVALQSVLDAPDRYDAVVSLLGPAGRLLDTALWGVGGRAAGLLLRNLPRRGLRVFHRGLHWAMSSPTTYPAGRLLGLYGEETSRKNVAALVEHIGRLDSETLRQMLLSAGESDLLPRLAELEAPLLIISGERDAFAPTHTVGRQMHAAAPGSRLVVMGDGTHGSVFGHASAIVATIDRFLAEHGQ